MKHLYICLLLFITIVITGLIADRYIKKELNIISADVHSFIDNSDYNDKNMHITTEAIKKRFYDKKNMLLLFINKEHIQEIEKTISLMENAAYNTDIDEYQILSIELYYLCRHAKSDISDFI
ncbi:MAG: hypothetical protein IKU54_02365 [Oscillospiraceae bacterium]|nr:hypothetical protein [Oscillospiraceae bacterium]